MYSIERYWRYLGNLNYFLGQFFFTTQTTDAFQKNLTPPVLSLAPTQSVPKKSQVQAPPRSKAPLRAPRSTFSTQARMRPPRSQGRYFFYPPFFSSSSMHYTHNIKKHLLNRALAWDCLLEVAHHPHPGKRWSVVGVLQCLWFSSLEASCRCSSTLGLGLCTLQGSIRTNTRSSAQKQGWSEILPRVGGGSENWS